MQRAAEAHGLLVVEDACQAHGATWRGRPVGSFGAAAAFSFYPGKNLGALGDGGAVTTNDDDIAATARLYRNHGQVDKYTHAGHRVLRPASQSPGGAPARQARASAVVERGPAKRRP